VSERKRVEKQIAAFSLLGYRLSSATAPEQAARIILDVASELFGWDAGYVDLYDHKADKIMPILAVDTIGGQRVPVPSSNPSNAPSALMRLVMKEGSRLINRAGDSSLPVKLVKFGDTDRRSASRMYVPIHSRGSVLGILSIQSYKEEAYTGDDLKLLQTLADHCGNALERIRVGEALREAEAKYRSIFENATEGIFRMTPDGHLLSANPALALMFGYKSPDEMISNVTKVGRQIFVNPKKRSDLKELLETQGSVQGFEAENSRQDGSKIWISLNVHVVRDAKRAILYYEGTMQDITERKKAEEELRHLPRRIIEAQETERLRVARELHDGVNQILASAKMRLRKVEEHASALTPAIREILSRCSGLLVQALEENRRIAHNLRPSDLDELGLAAACRHYCQELEARTSLVVKCNIAQLDRRLPPASELSLFRIVQEGLNNVEKHAQATTVAVRLALRGSHIVLTIQDDGRGFGPEKPKLDGKKRRGIGLTNLRERAAHLGGTCDVTSVPRQGTTVTVRAPLRDF
jgi:PAS domain S-box-containing protein